MRWKRKSCYLHDCETCRSKVHSLEERSTNDRLIRLDLAMDQGNPPENWFEVFTFVREVRNQLQSSRPFISNAKNVDEQQQHEQTRKYSNDDEGIILMNPEYQYISSASSTASSDDLEQISSSTSSICTTYETVKDELKFHYNGLLDSLTQLTSLANRVTEKYRDGSIF